MSERKWSHLDGPKRLHEWRDRVAKLTQQAAADSMKIDLASYNSFERGRERPGLDYAVAIEKATGGYVKAVHWAEDINPDIKRARAS